MMPKSPSPPHNRPANLQDALERAALALRAQRFDEAERLAEGVLRADRSNRLAAQLLGQARLLQGRPEAAIEPLQRAARRSQDPAIETLLARAFNDAGRGAEALDQLRQATTRRPPYPLAFVELGDRLGRDGCFDEARSVLEEGSALAPDAAILRMALGYHHLKTNDRAAARALFLEVRAVAPDRYDAQVALASVLVLDGEYPAAAALYRAALALRPGDAMTAISLGKCLLEMGDREAGEAVLRGVARGAAPTAGLAVAALAATPHGRFFLRPSAAAKFLGAGAA